ncbi:cell surface A33 antigen-like isoform X1 [Leucoraja erinacea]|uniref:cell surface A33 antigen-like isoform X1 n=2 Tax=Leucoraja erinaceus TaxID=7782 RepID=UPI00245409DE|nr:cell surface A33 antigen-like isoform X1 [Leucoraja erinacea]
MSGAALLYLLAALTSLNAMNVNVKVSHMEIARGDALHLQCTYQTIASTKNHLTIEWILVEEVPSEEPTVDVIQYFYGGVYSFGKRYKGRVNFTGDANGEDCSIAIQNAQITDTGTYVVEVTSRDDLVGTRKETVDVIVLVPPTPPVCKIEGKAEYGETVKLMCHSEEGSPTPVYTWQNYSPMNQPRQMPQMSIQESDGLTLKNISAKTSGFFICTSKNKIRAASCNITLAVMPPSMNIAFYGGIIGGAVGVLIILGIIVYCCCCRGEEKLPEDYEMEDPRYEEEEPAEGYPKRDDNARTYREDDPNENAGRNSPRTTVRQPLVPPNKPTFVPDDNEV